MPSGPWLSALERRSAPLLEQASGAELASLASALRRLRRDPPPLFWLDAFATAGARVIAVTPRTESLEDLFVQRAKEG